MRRVVLLSLAALFAVPAPRAHAQPQPLPPHAWLFGTWTGGIFPVPSRIPLEACLAQPVVIFTRDLVLRARLTDQLLSQRVIETARAIQGGADFRFAASAGTPRLFGGDPSAVGFGCASNDELTVQRRSENEIEFPGCSDFPYPLVRCR